jgi:hypothetical protein
VAIAMRAFYGNVVMGILRVRMGSWDSARLFAHTDYALETVIHPWVDGCGRHATAFVMWLAMLTGGNVPVFGTREAHYAAMKAKDPEQHVAYYRECLERTM